MKIIIPSDNAALADRCVSSIANLDPTQLTNIIIVTGDTIIMQPLVEAYDVSVILRPDPFVFAQAVNVAISSLENEDVFLLNDDCVLDSRQGLSAMAELGRYTDIGVVSAGMKGVGGNLRQQVATVGALRLLTGKDMTGDVSFTAALITKTAIDQVGLLDESFSAYGWEDNDYCHRTHQAGLHVGIFDGCVVRHEHISSTFGNKGAFSKEMLQGEIIFRDKWRNEPKQPVVVVGASRSGASVLSHCLNEMEVSMIDPAPIISPSSSAYYRDNMLASLIPHEDVGARVYALRREALSPHDAWGTRLWPSPEGVQRLLEQSDDPILLVVRRSREAILRSYCLFKGATRVTAEEMVDKELADLDLITKYALDHEIPTHQIMYDDLVFDTRSTLERVAKTLGYTASLVSAVNKVHKNLYNFFADGTLYEHTPPEDWGTIAISWRTARLPQPNFTTSLAALCKSGLREGDVLLSPSIYEPAHLGATNIMRQFLASGCDTLLMIDDDMTFNDDILEILRTNQENFSYDIVSALATGRTTPPKAIVMRKSEQPPLPDSTAGTYYSMIVDDVVNGEVLPVDITGLAFTLIRRGVIERMTSEHGPSHSWYVNWGEGGEGEDARFCREAGSLGFRVAVDASAHVGHMGVVVYGYDEFDYWRKQQSGVALRAEDVAEIFSESVANGQMSDSNASKVFEVLANRESA